MTKVIMGDKVIFNNPTSLAVENLKLSITNDGVIKSVPALDPFWVEKRSLSLYTVAPKGSKIVLGSLQAWKESMQWYIDDLTWLLSMKYHRFWSHIVHYSPCMDMLVSFLQEAYPPYLQTHDDPSVMILYNQAYKKVLVIFSRLVTNKESMGEWMNSNYLGQLIYEKFIFTIPILWDLCLLYGSNNGSVISKIMKIVFQLQPKYYEDVSTAVAFLKQLFSFISIQIDNRNSMHLNPPILPGEFKGFSQSFGGLNSHSVQDNGNSLTFPALQDLTLHLVDCAITLKTFLELHNPARLLFREKKFHISLINLYESTLPRMYERVFELGEPKSEESGVIFSQLDLVRLELMDSYRLILATTIDDILSGSSDVETNVSLYLAMMVDSLSEKTFIKDYNAVYPVDADLDILCQAYKDMDSLKCDFILEAVRANCEDHHLSHNIEESSSHYENIEVVNGHGLIDDAQNTPENTENNEIPEEAKTISLISEVKDILPHLGDGYVLKCLEHYGFNTERVINSVLEGTLDAELQDIDPTLPIIPSDPLDTIFLETGIDRLNVFDNDEFDVMTRDNIDTSKIHKGKRKPKHKNLSEMLDDKSYVKQMKDTYSKFSLVSDEPDLYDDEYDDTYDGGVPELVDEASADSEKQNNFKSKPLRTFGKHVAESEDEGDEEDEEASYSNTQNTDSFCVNPEEIRARYQARRDMKYGTKPPSDRDVVGKAKGQGQEKGVLLNRQKKGAHKATSGNHNRRSGAQFKRNQGMMPS